jgi:hypothetical protein
MELASGNLYQHKKHDPSQGKYHQYRLETVTAAAKNERGEGVPKDVACLYGVFHTEEEVIWEVCDNEGPLVWLYNSARNEWATEPHAIYSSILKPFDKVFARPLKMFIEPGRFTQIDLEQVSIPGHG